MLSHNLGYTGTVNEYCLETGADLFITSKGKVLPDNSYLCSGYDCTEAYSTDYQEPAIAIKIHTAEQAGKDFYHYIYNNRHIAFFKRKRYRRWIPLGEIPNLNDITAWGEVLNYNWLFENSSTSDGTSFNLPTDKYKYDSIDRTGIVMDDGEYQRHLIHKGKAEPCGLADFRLYRFDSYEEFKFITDMIKPDDILSIKIGGIGYKIFIEPQDSKTYIKQVAPSSFPHKKCKSPQGISEELEDYEVHTDKNLYTYKLRKNEIILEFQVQI